MRIYNAYNISGPVCGQRTALTISNLVARTKRNLTIERATRVGAMGCQDCPACIPSGFAGRISALFYYGALEEASAEHSHALKWPML